MYLLLHSQGGMLLLEFKFCNFGHGIPFMAGALLWVQDVAQPKLWSHSSACCNVPQPAQVHAAGTEQTQTPVIRLPFAKPGKVCYHFFEYGNKASVLPGFQDFAENSF